MSLGIHSDDLAQQQQNLDEIHVSRTYVIDMKLADVVLTPSVLSLLCDISSGFPDPVVPPRTQCQVCDLLHGLSHLGIHALQCLVGDCFVWFGMLHDVAK